MKTDRIGRSLWIRRFFAISIIAVFGGIACVSGIAVAERVSEKSAIHSRLLAYDDFMLNFGAYYLQNEADSKKSTLPPLVRGAQNGEIGRSWRLETFLMLPVPCSRTATSWLSPEYEKLREDPGSIGRRWFATEASPKTTVFAVGGSGSAFDEEHAVSAAALPDDVILFADVYGSESHWMEPGDFDVNNLPKGFRMPGGLGSKEYPGCIVAFADGSIWHLREDTPFNQIQKFLTVTGAEKWSRETELGPYADRRLTVRGQLLWRRSVTKPAS